MVVVLPMTLPASTVSMASKLALLTLKPVVVPLATTLKVLAATVLLTSRSITLSVPAAVSLAFVSVRVTLALSPLPMLISGVSLVAETVTVKVAAVLVARPSLAVTLKTRLAAVGVSLLLL